MEFEDFVSQIVSAFPQVPEVVCLIAEYARVLWTPWSMMPGAYHITNFIGSTTTVPELQSAMATVPAYKLQFGGRCGWTALEVAVGAGNFEVARWIAAQPVTLGLHEGSLDLQVSAPDDEYVNRQRERRNRWLHWDSALFPVPRMVDIQSQESLSSLATDDRGKACARDLEIVRVKP